MIEDILLSTAKDLQKTAQDLLTYNDIDSVLDEFLLQLRRYTQADAGSVYLEEDGRLVLSYAQNDTLFKDPTAAARELYNRVSIEINERSITGWVAQKKEPLNLANVHALDPRYPFSFNDSFDKRSGYQTVSMLTVPILSLHKRLLGIVQLINAKGEGGWFRPFTAREEGYTILFSFQAASVLEKSQYSRELLLRMLKIVELRDPKETSDHVLRVGTYAAEIYQIWARKKGFEDREIRRVRGTLRLAAMLHDIGKVGIADVILSKPTRLNNEDLAEVQKHSTIGSDLFANPRTEMERMAYNIILHHHQRYDGQGYPVIVQEDGRRRALKGEEIPIEARVVAVADVFDALGSPRAYKPAFSDEMCRKIILREANAQFDPEVVEAFEEAFPILQKIRLRFSPHLKGDEGEEELRRVLERHM